MTQHTSLTTRRTVLVLGASAAACVTTGASAQSKPVIKVSKDPNCGCCTGWVEHLRSNGFVAAVTNSADMQAVKVRLGVPEELCVLPYGRDRRLRHRGARTGAGHPAFAGRRSLPPRPCRARHADRLTRHGRRHAGGLRGDPVRQGSTRQLRSLHRRSAGLTRPHHLAST